MKPLYFGDTQNQLYGVYHQANNESNSGIVICPPIGEEYIRAHRAITRIASKLASNDFHVLRFDYFSTGDSAGATGEGGTERWTNDIHTAIQNLSDISGAKRISLLGFRFGATLAALATHANKIDKLVLVDPVKDGKDYLYSLAQINGVLLKQHKRKIQHTKKSIPIRENEYLGFLFPEKLQQSIAKTKLYNCNISANKAHILSTDNQDTFTEIIKKFDESPTNMKYSFFGLKDNWNNLESLKQANIPPTITQSIMSFFTES